MKNKKGFTLIEVALFLAISGCLITAVIGTASSNVQRRRYNDSVNDLVSYLRKAYSEAISVENVRETDDGNKTYYCSISSINLNTGSGISSNATSGTDNYPGRTNCVMYGKLVTFGELDAETGQPSTDIHMYDVIGTVYDTNINTASPDARIALKIDTGSNVVTIKSSTSRCELGYAGQSESYTPYWSARLEVPGSKDLYTGAILIARSPISGTVRTYVYTGSTGHELDVNSDNFGEADKDYAFDIQYLVSRVDTANATCDNGNIAAYTNKYSNKFLNSTINSNLTAANSIVIDENKTYFKDETITLCVGGDEANSLGNSRRAIQILKDGNNSTAVKLANQDDDISEQCRL